jgi:hypothetical protein
LSVSVMTVSLRFALLSTVTLPYSSRTSAGPIVTVMSSAVVTGRAGSTLVVVIWLLARFLTSNVVVPAMVLELPVTAVAETVGDVDVALIPRQVLSWLTESAAVLSADILALTDWYEPMVFSTVLTLALRRSCGAASTFIS